MMYLPEVNLDWVVARTISSELQHRLQALTLVGPRSVSTSRLVVRMLAKLPLVLHRLTLLAHYAKSQYFETRTGI